MRPHTAGRVDACAAIMGTQCGCRRLVIVDKQGMSGKKAEYHSVPYRSITQFSVETAGTFDADSELVIWISGGGEVRKQFGRKSNILEVQQVLAWYTLQ